MSKVVRESNNGHETLHGTGDYNQHLGGPYGNSQPNFGGELLFTHRFKLCSLSKLLIVCVFSKCRK